ncbi:MAG: hypothetical protein KME19_10880 [Microcoleus vaginatus WJT46-NPBG5]|jgi:5-methylcytosine-specific restriction endonuclease McrA|nr:hypothetical protein [Microcoleus vaginatus WJT46-NPBG5]
MLHKINLPNCEEQFKKIFAFQRQILAFACDPKTSISVEGAIVENEIYSKFSGDIGVWLWRKKLWVNKRDGSREQSDLQKGLVKLIKAAQAHQTVSLVVLDAFDNDIQFCNCFNKPTFEFWYKTRLNVPIQEALKDLMEVFYTKLLEDGFPEAVHGNVESFKRIDFVSEFWRVNDDIEVCPACDSPRPDRVQRQRGKGRNSKVQTKIYGNLDHFFPKRKYPFLSVHHANLVSLCEACNLTFKKEEDPVDPENSTQPLVHTFLPYLNPAIDSIEVKVTRNKEGVHLPSLTEKDGTPSRRIDNLNRVFKLEARWHDRLRYVIGTIRDGLSGDGRRWRRKVVELNEQDLKDFLQDMLEDCINSQKGKIHYGILKSSYLSFAIEDEAEIAELFTQFTGL